jgi:hypothetical protein
MRQIIMVAGECVEEEAHLMEGQKAITLEGTPLGTHFLLLGPTS